MMTDPIADLATRLRNANVAYHPTVKIPHSRLKAGLLKLLAREGMIRGVVEEGDGVKKTLSVAMAYGPNRERLLSGIRRVSRPGLRTYAGKDALPRARAGRVAIVSTSKGLLTSAEAKRHNVGGEVLLEVW